ncbi:mechanosensitive ion channel family protein [Pleomorphovibrio marinus]|uniref:mechanosensitive ion channel family protein n=1 Tax=Pleomorphovibrio marinus TaxID=2164132 RepID=UPI000E0A7122|nr:mechanosensitive ion channel family protein [Pleomorphovibrio marinus]
MNFGDSFEKLKEIFLEDIEDFNSLIIGLLIAGVVLVVFIFISKWIKNLIVNKLNRRGNDHLLVEFIAAGVRGVIILFALTIIFRFFGLTGIVSGILAGAGITAFIVGFALKDIGENFLAGILLAFKRPYRIGDIVEINGVRGRVLMLNLRDTQVKTPDGKDVFIPNASIIKNPLTNFTIDGFLAYSFVVGLDYGCDYEKAMVLIKNTITTVPGVLKGNKKPTINVTELAASTLNVTVTYWVNTHNKSQPDPKVRSNAILSVLTALEEAGFNLPGNIVELKNHNQLPIKHNPT